MNKVLYLLVFLTFDAIAINYQAELACVLHLGEKCSADFILSLTDPCIKDIECLKPWVPSSDSPNPDDQILFLKTR